MQALNLPPFDIKTRQHNGAYQLYDPVRRLWVAHTPEEWVRQHFVNYLVHQLGYVQGRMANEYSIRINGMNRRCDTVVFDKRLHPLLIAEYKAPSVAITQKVFAQVLNYCTSLHPRYIVVSNGLEHYCCELIGEEARFLTDIPAYQLATDAAE